MPEFRVCINWEGGGGLGSFLSFLAMHRSESLFDECACAASYRPTPATLHLPLYLPRRPPLSQSPQTTRSVSYICYSVKESKAASLESKEAFGGPLE